MVTQNEMIGGELTQELPLNEWLESGVDAQIFALNVRVLAGDAPYSYLLYEIKAASGRVHPDAQWRWARKKYRHIEQGGWWCSGLDPLNNWEPMLWGCFKPHTPRRGAAGKIIKYEHPPQVATRLFCLGVPLHIWQRVSHRYGVPLPENLIITETGEAIGFWRWVLENKLPIILTEGAKKAGALLTAGYVAIALPGIWNGRRVNREAFAASLIPDLAIFATPGRGFYFCFDHDTKPKTVANVNGAIAKTGQLLIEAGCLVKVIQLPGPEKGVDDFIAACGQTAFDAVYQNALSWGQWQWTKRQETALTYAPNVLLEVADLSTVNLKLPEAGIVAIKAAKGTGKTKLISQATNASERLLSLTHRIFLGRSLAERLRYIWRTDADKGQGFISPDGQITWRLGSCVESLLAIDLNKFQGCDLVIDEACQVLGNLLTSSTCNRDGIRPALLARLHWLIRVAKRIIVADADLDNFTLDYIRTLRGDDAPVYLVRNDYQPAGYHCTLYDAPSSEPIMAHALSAVQAGKRIFIATDSKSASEVLAELVAAGISRERIIVINGDTSGEKQQREYVSQINQSVSDYDIVIATGSMATGVSIETQWFDEVIGIFYGVVPDSDIAQALARVRDTVPRHVWVQARGKNFCPVSRSENPWVIKRQLKTRWDREVALIRSSLNPDLVPVVDAPVDWDNCPHKRLWSQVVAGDNFSMWHLRDCLVARLQYEGHQVEVMHADTDTDFKTFTKTIKTQLEEAHHQAVAAAKIRTPKERDQLESKEGLSVDERLDLEKTTIAEFACTHEVTPELVEMYSELVTAVPRYEDLRYRLAIERDERAILRQHHWNQGLFIPDLPTREQERLVRERLGLLQWVDRLLAGETLSNQDLESLGEKVRFYYQEVNEVLRLGFSPNSAKWSNVRIFNQLLKQLGIPTLTARVGRAKTSTTSLDLERWELIEGILERREARRLEKREPEALKQRWVDNGSYITNQVAMSTSIQDKSPDFQPDAAAVQDAVDWLMGCKIAEQAQEAFFAFRTLPGHLKQAIWSLIPRWKRRQLWQWRLAWGT